MKTFILVAAAGLVWSAGAATASPLGHPSGIAAERSAIHQIKNTKPHSMKHRMKSKTGEQKMEGMQGMDHSKMNMKGMKSMDHSKMKM